MIAESDIIFLLKLLEGISIFDLRAVLIKI